MWYGNTAGEEVYSEGSATPHTKEAEPERPKNVLRISTCAHTASETATEFCMVIVRKIVSVRTRMLTRYPFAVTNLLVFHSCVFDASFVRDTALRLS